ncbi:hypothetical protein [Actinocatenispora sera]|nr:hypothetical protein [Actinocatenispora sera]
MNTRLKHPGEIRAGAERRRRHRIVAVASAVTLAIAGLGGTAYAAGWGSAPTGHPAVSPTRSATASHRPSHRASPSRRNTPSPTGSLSERPDGGQSRGPSDGGASAECDLDAMTAATIDAGGVGGGHALFTVSMTYSGAKPCTLPEKYPELTYLCGGSAQADPEYCRLPAGHGTYFDGGPAKAYGGTVRPHQTVLFDVATVSEPSAGAERTYSGLHLVTQSGGAVSITGDPVSSTGGVTVGRWYHRQN